MVCNAPDHGPGGAQCLGPEATAYLSGLLPPGTSVRLESDRKRTDRYDRTLAAVFSADATLVNAEIARQGLAAVMVIDGNDRFYPAIAAAHDEAMAAGRGLFSPEIACTVPGQVKAVTVAANGLGRRACHDSRVKSAASVGMGETLRVVAARLRDETDDLVETMLARMRDEAPGFDTASRPELADGLRASCYGNIRAALQALGDDRQPPSNSPAEALNEARAAARAEIALEPLLHTYRIGHAVVLERLFALIEELDLSPSQRHSATLVGSRYLFAYVDRVVGEVSEEYTSERERTLRSSVQRRAQLVHDVLGGADVDSAELGYRLEQEHLAVVATGPSADTALRDLARRLERRLLTVAVADDTVWAWLGSARRRDRVERHDPVWAQTAGRTRFALGEPAWGLSGFRDSHGQALAAHRVAVRLPEAVTRYDDVALEAALLGDARVARRFVQHELGPLTAQDARTRVLRGTLASYLQSGLNAAATAAVLEVSDRTIAYRIRSVEDLLGRSVLGRSCELAAAVRLHRVLSP